MDWLERLAEVRIRRWQQRVEAGEQVPPPPPLVFESWESQLVREIVSLRREARSAAEPAPLLRRADDLELQLVVAVERDRPRLAQELRRVIARGVAADAPP